MELSETELNLRIDSAVAKAVAPLKAELEAAQAAQAAQAEKADKAAASAAASAKAEKAAKAEAEKTAAELKTARAEASASRRDAEIEAAFSGASFQKGGAKDMALAAFRASLAEDGEGAWKDGEGRTVADSAKAFVEHEDNAFLLAPAPAAAGTGEPQGAPAAGAGAPDALAVEIGGQTYNEAQLYAAADAVGVWQ